MRNSNDLSKHNINSTDLSGAAVPEKLHHNDIVAADKELTPIKVKHGRVSLTDIQFTEHDMQKLCHELKHNKSIRSIDLNNCTLNEAGAKHLIKLVRENKNIIAINLDYRTNKIGFEIEFDLTTALEKNKKSASLGNMMSPRLFKSTEQTEPVAPPVIIPRKIFSK